MGNKTSDMTVAEASDLLGVTTRSILNYINGKDIDALKVGKSWYIKRASLESFSKKFNFSPTSPPNEGKKDFPKVPKGKRNTEYSEKKFTVNNLRLFVMANEVMSSSLFSQFSTDERINKRVEELRTAAFEFIGAGYYSFGPAKKMELYEKSREKVGAILALFYGDFEASEKTKRVVRDIENELLPAYSALIKRMDNKINENSKSL